MTPPVGPEDFSIPAGLSLASTKERVRARFNIIHVAWANLLLHRELKPTPEERARYAEERPAGHDELQRLQRQYNMQNQGTIIGSALGTGLVLRFSRVPPVVLAGVVMATFTSYVVADDISTWVCGTYKFDSNRSAANYLHWVRDSRAAAASASSAKGLAVAAMA